MLHKVKLHFHNQTTSIREICVISNTRYELALYPNCGTNCIYGRTNKISKYYNRKYNIHVVSRQEIYKNTIQKQCTFHQCFCETKL